jgi:hypothetical protein
MHVYLFCEIEKKKDAMYVSKESARKNEEKIKKRATCFLSSRFLPSSYLPALGVIIGKIFSRIREENYKDTH